MRNISIAAVCVAMVLSFAGSSASVRTPIHFIYTKPGATFDQFRSDRDDCHHKAVKARWYPAGRGHWGFTETPSSTAFLNCMADRGYTLARNGWDTGVLWVLSYRPVNWHGSNWYMVEPAGLITSGPYASKDACLADKPSDSHALDCVWLDRDPDTR